MSELILFVDDDVNLLNAMKRQYRKQFNLRIAEGADAALDLIQTTDSFAVAIVDMQMPGMSGLQLLEKIAKVSPDTVRIMLTGNADQQTAVDAINQGKIFRFFNKPCAQEVLTKGIHAGIAQHNLVTVERDLFERTLAGSVKTLVDVLTIVDPDGFGKSDKVRDWANIVGKHLNLRQSWRLTISAMLSELGNITIPTEILAKISNGESLTDAEQGIVNACPEVSRDLIRNIPRLEAVSEIVYMKGKGFDGSGLPRGGPCGQDIPKEARILKILLDLETKTHGAYPPASAFSALLEHKEHYDLEFFGPIRECLESERIASEEKAPEEVELPVSLLLAGYTLLVDLKLEDEKLILCSGSRLSKVQVEKIRAFSKLYKFQEPVRVLRTCLESERIASEEKAPEEVELPVSLLLAGYTLLVDLKLEDGKLILCSGSRLSKVQVEKIRAFSKLYKFQEPVRVLRTS
jgi:response regulator RpfG family c-di-GMP phosphodiesterase